MNEMLDRSPRIESLAFAGTRKPFSIALAGAHRATRREPIRCVTAPNSGSR
jgi:hypothetical protein